jgi:hypothetical protein
MAKVAISKKLTAKPKIKQPRLSRSAVKTIDDKYYGSEPIDISVRGFTNALNWYNYMFDQDGVRDWIFEYMKRNEYARSDIAAVKRIPKYRVAKTDCVIARIIMNGNTLSEEVVGRFKANIDAYISAGRLIKEEVVTTAAVEKPQPTIQERTKLKIQQLLSECEDATDSDAGLNIYEWLKGKEASVQAATVIRDHYAAWLPDFEEDEFDTRIMKKKRAERKKYWESFIADCDRYCGNKKATKVRKPREKKAKSAVDLVSKIKYQKEFPSLKIMSVNPAEMIGASQVWTYNTKYRKLTRYDASGPRGIQARGASLIGYDVEKSQTKSVRKPEVTIQQVLSAGKVALRSIMTELKTNETQPNGRINTDTVILRVIK